uniref:Uncharacterized protein n=1 Tax=Trichogramma kaykai TaxID=54128 RepID=A0ABD2XPA2_9HYME
MFSGDESFQGRAGEHVALLNQEKLEKLKSLREKIDWEVKENRSKFLRKIHPVIKDWKIGLPDLRGVFQRGEIDRLLLESVDVIISTRYSKYFRQGERFIKFVALTGYKDEPETDKDGKLILRRATPLHHAARGWFFNKDTVMRELFKIYHRCDANYTDENDLTHFHVACKYGYADVVRKFLEVGQDPNLVARNSGVNTLDPPLHLALQHENWEIVELLLRNGSDPNLANVDGYTALHVACRNCSRDLLSMLLRTCDEVGRPVNVDAPDKWGNTPLHQALTFCTNDIFIMLLRHGADPNVGNEEGSTSLHKICQKQEDDDALLVTFFQISELLDRTVEVDALDKLGNAPLHLALRYGNKKVAIFLLLSGADPNLTNLEGQTPLHIICQENAFQQEYAFARSFFKACHDNDRRVRVDALDKSGNTPLHVALSRGRKDLAQVLLTNGANPNLANRQGSTALHVICKCNYNDDSAMMLFDLTDARHKPIRVDARDKLYQTPLELAVASLLPNVLDALLDNGADLSRFVFPATRYFDKRLQSGPSESRHDFKLRQAAGILIIVERLEKEGYELSPSQTKMMMKLFIKQGLGEKSVALERSWLHDERFKKRAKKIMITQKLSIYHLVQLRPRVAAKRVTHKRYVELARSRELSKLPRGSRDACALHLCEKLARPFFLDWALDRFYELIHKRLPAEICEMVLDDMSNKDLYHIYLAGTNQS